MKKLIAIFLTLFAFSTMANVTMTIECGDAAHAYVDMDLSRDFQNQYLSEKMQEEYKAEGYKYMVAGRNCGLGSWQSQNRYEVLILRGKKGILEFRHDLLGPLSINPSVISLTLKNVNVLDNGVELSGKKEKELIGEDATGRLETKRGRGKVKIIIKKL